MSIYISVIVATRNRKSNIKNLLDSIQESNRTPDVISIVSSGDNIDKEIEKYAKSIKIIHQHSDIVGQVAQRNIAISNLDKKYDINIFLDDDIIVKKNLFSKCEEFFLSNSPGGVGFKIFNEKKSFELLLSKASVRKGRVLKSGKNINYQGLKRIKRVDWLNGIAAWSFEVLQNFQNASISNKYAAAEDLIFSYQVGKKFDLYFHPELIVFPQEGIPDLRSEFESYLFEVQHKLFFVLTNVDKSFFRFTLRLAWVTLYLVVIFPFRPKITKLQMIKINLKALYFILRNKKNLTINNFFRDKLIKERLL